jgi:hypothetical protein
MKKLAVELKSLPAQVLEHEYSYESFGSWSLTLRYRGQVFRLTFDGKERWCVLQESAEWKAPYQWNEIVWEKRCEQSDLFPQAELISFVRNLGLG